MPLQLILQLVRNRSYGGKSPDMGGFNTDVGSCGRRYNRDTKHRCRSERLNSESTHQRWYSETVRVKVGHDAASIPVTRWLSDAVIRSTANPTPRKQSLKGSLYTQSHQVICFMICEEYDDDFHIAFLIASVFLFQ